MEGGEGWNREDKAEGERVSNRFLSRPATRPVRARRGGKEGLTPRVLRDEVEVFTADDDGAVHLGRDDLAGENASTDRDETREGALLVDVSALNSLTGSLYTRGKLVSFRSQIPTRKTQKRGPTDLEAEADLLVPAAVLAGNLARGRSDLGVVEQRLLLEGLLNLLGHGPV